MIKKTMCCASVFLMMQVHAGRPFATEDAGVLEQASCEIESAYAREKARAGNKAQEWSIQPSCGLGFNTQLGVGYGRGWQDGVAERGQWLAGKTAIKTLSDKDWGLTVAYSARRQQAEGDHYRLSETVVNGVVSVPVSAWLVHGNWGWNKPRQGEPQAMSWALALEKPEAIGPLDLGVETFGDNRCSPWVQVGARWAVIKERFFLDASLGQQIDTQRTRALTAGMKITF